METKCPRARKQLQSYSPELYVVSMDAHSMYDSQVLIKHKKNLDYIVTLPFKEVPQCTFFLRILSGRKKKDMTQRANFGGVLKNPSTVFIAGFFTVLVAQPR